MRILNEAELLQYTADDDDGDVAMEKNLGEFSGALELAEITDLETENPGELSPLQKAADLGLNHHVQVSSRLLKGEWSRKQPGINKLAKRLRAVI